MPQITLDRRLVDELLAFLQFEEYAAGPTKRKGKPFQELIRLRQNLQDAIADDALPDVAQRRFGPGIG